MIHGQHGVGSRHYPTEQGQQGQLHHPQRRGKAAALVSLLLAPPLPGWVVRFWEALPATHSHGWVAVTVWGLFGGLQLTSLPPPQLLHTLYVPAIMSGRGIFPRIPEKVLPIPR